MNSTISLNGADRPWRDQSMLDLLAETGIAADRKGVAVALNGEVVPRGRWAESHPAPGDRVEIVHIVRGG